MDQAEDRKRKVQISKQRPSLNGPPFTGNTETLEDAQNGIST